MAVPSNPDDLKKIKAVIKDISDSLTMIEDRRSYINDAKKALREDHEIDAKVLSMMIKIFHNQNLDEIIEQLDDCEAVINA